METKVIKEEENRHLGKHQSGFVVVIRTWYFILNYNRCLTRCLGVNINGEMTIRHLPSRVTSLRLPAVRPRRAKPAHLPILRLCSQQQLARVRRRRAPQHDLDRCRVERHDAVRADLAPLAAALAVRILTDDEGGDVLWR
jgi:hypothetical protein